MLHEQYHERFWQKVERGEAGACWNWTASVAGKGYGQFKNPLTRENLYAHRVAYELENGPIGGRQYVCHRCDNPRCCNPSHLFLGSARENARDMVRKGRQLWGSKNPRSRLQAEAVKAIRHLAETTDMTNREIGMAFSIHPNSVSRIVNRTRWAKVE